MSRQRLKLSIKRNRAIVRLSPFDNHKASVTFRQVSGCDCFKSRFSVWQMNWLPWCQAWSYLEKSAGYHSYLYAQLEHARDAVCSKYAIKGVTLDGTESMNRWFLCCGANRQNNSISSSLNWAACFSLLKPDWTLVKLETIRSQGESKLPHPGTRLGT